MRAFARVSEIARTFELDLTVPMEYRISYWTHPEAQLTSIIQYLRMSCSHLYFVLRRMLSCNGLSYANTTIMMRVTSAMRFLISNTQIVLWLPPLVDRMSHLLLGPLTKMLLQGLWNCSWRICMPRIQFSRLRMSEWLRKGLLRMGVVGTHLLAWL